MKKNEFYKLINLFLITILVLFSTTNVKALEIENYYIEEKIEIISTSISRSSNTRIARKTNTVKNSAGQSLWYVQVEGTYIYTGNTSICTKSIVYAESYFPTNWKITTKSSSKSGSVASAKATGKYYAGGMYIESMTRSVSLTCDSKGNVY